VAVNYWIKLAKSDRKVKRRLDPPLDFSLGFFLTTDFSLSGVACKAKTGLLTTGSFLC